MYMTVCFAMLPASENAMMSKLSSFRGLVWLLRGYSQSLKLSNSAASSQNLCVSSTGSFKSYSLPATLLASLIMFLRLDKSGLSRPLLSKNAMTLPKSSLKVIEPSRNLNRSVASFPSQNSSCSVCPFFLQPRKIFGILIVITSNSGRHFRPK